MLDLMIHAALVAAALFYWGLSLWTVFVEMAADPQPVTPMDGFNRSVARWGYVGQARGQA